MHIALTGGLKSLPINIIICIEGEEEIGSNGFPHFLENNKDIFENVEVRSHTPPLHPPLRRLWAEKEPNRPAVRGWRQGRSRLAIPP